VTEPSASDSALRIDSERFLDTLGQTDELPATDDVLARVLPLFEQVALVHEAQRVAPLEGVESIRAIAGRLFFASGETREPKRDVRVAQLMTQREGGVRVAGRYRSDDEAGRRDLSVGDLETPSERPVYLPRYVAWEHVVGHHDPLTDIFSLGIVAASVALDADLGEPEQLERFVEHRRDLVKLNPRLHPVVARVIAGMTEIDRRERSQDLPSLLAVLRSYREQRIDLELASDGKTTRRTAIFRRLRDRLFDFSRRNRLLYFKPTAATIDLTAASVPLVLDVRNIAADALFTFRGKPADDLLAEKPFPLARYVRFEDYPFVAPALDAVRLEAKRSRAELGFSQLRLVVCFLHWHDLKEAPDERIHSPLLLLPVEVDKKRGVRDAFTLAATDDRAEVNPVLRQYLRQRYSIDLPEFVDLSDAGALDALHESLVAQIQATEPGVTLDKVDRPSIDLVLAVARKRLDAYRRKVKLSGRNARSRLGLDYAYLGDHVRPLGVQLFHTYVAPRAAPDSIMHDPPRPIVWKAQPDDTITKELYSLKQAADEGGPYRWSFDLTTVTLAHFNYRNVSLVRDYATLMDGNDDAANPAFAALFREDAKPVEDTTTPLPLPERHEVVLADPTQSSAVARSRTGASYVIQGPPGTGKSQTITNLIADHVARGKRVLFVCEKRAALDVVHHRLVQVGIGPLACLIHDAHEDKKEFLKDLKETYEGWLATGETTTARQRRDAALVASQRLLDRGNRLEVALREAPSGATVSLLAMLRRAVELRELEAATPDGVELPAPRAVADALPAIERLESSLRALGHAGPLATHPARLLGPALFDRAPTSDDVARIVGELSHELVAIDACHALARDRGTALAMRDVASCHELALRVRPLVAAGLAALLDTASESTKQFRARLARVAERDRELAKASEGARGWRDPLPPDDASRALVLAKKFEGGFVARLFRWLSPAWWKLRKLLVSRFDVASRAVLGDWTDILDALLAKQRAATALDEVKAKLATELHGLDPNEVRALVDAGDSLAPAARALRELMIADAVLARSATDVAQNTRGLADHLALFRGWEHLDAPAFQTALSSLVRDAVALTPLRGPIVELDRAAPTIAALLRRWPLSGAALEAIVARKAIATALRERAPDLALAEGTVDAFGDEMRRAAAELRDANAGSLVETVRSRFVEAAQLATAPAAGLSPEQKESKRTYAAGRRELEHELGKVMRHKTIREIASGPAGPVVRDLKPIWLMSPLSVADVLPLEGAFDLVIFDEASQIPLENAVPAIHRASQVIVVGDRQQLPPTNFFAASLEDDSEEADEALAALDRELDADSLLTHADRTLPSTLLGWHYRSRHESLIDFSNRAFYSGRLLTIPPVEESAKRAPIVARMPEEGAVGAERLLERPISFHQIDGLYEARRNVPEARYIAHLVRELLAKRTGHTIGIVAFSEAQQGAIESALGELADRDAAMRARLDEEMAREEDGQHVGLFVKNLENVQGDERDIIIVSVCYGPDPRGRMIMNFGPINRRGGERRLNVIFSRAKHHIAVVSTIDHARITNDYNDGAACLKSYLQYAASSSVGDVAGARAALLATTGDKSVREVPDPVVADIARALRARGWEVAEGLGASRLRCDLAMRRPHESRYRLGVLVDRPDHWALGVDEAVRLKPGVLQAFGWKITTVLTKDWLGGPEQIARALDERATS
jgi:AAA domain/Protein of unknown function (DUF4011)